MEIIKDTDSSLNERRAIMDRHGYKPTRRRQVGKIDHECGSVVLYRSTGSKAAWIRLHASSIIP
jgi:hypothetical protein